MNAMYEVSPWPGVLFRVANGSQYELQLNGGSGNYNKKYQVADTKKVVIKRVNGIIYISVNDEDFIETKNHSNITTFDTIPVVFGCSVLTDANLTEQRYWKGTLSNMRAILYE